MRPWVVLLLLLVVPGCFDAGAGSTDPQALRALADEAVAGIEAIDTLDTVIAAPIVRDGSRVTVPTTLYTQAQSSVEGSRVWTFTYNYNDPGRTGTYAVTVGDQGVIDQGHWGGAFNQVGCRAALGDWTMRPEQVLEAVGAEGTHVWSLHIAHACYEDEVVWVFGENRALRLVVDATGEVISGEAFFDYNMPPA